MVMAAFPPCCAKINISRKESRVTRRGSCDHRSIATGEVGRDSFSSKEGKGIDTRPRVASNPLKNAPAIQRETSVSLMTAPVSAQRSSRNTGLCEVVRMHTAPRILISKESATPAHPSETPLGSTLAVDPIPPNTINVIIAATTPYNPAKRARSPPAFLMGAHAILECFTIQLHIIAEERPPLSKNFN